MEYLSNKYTIYEAKGQVLDYLLSSSVNTVYNTEVHFTECTNYYICLSNISFTKNINISTMKNYMWRMTEILNTIYAGAKQTSSN